MFGIDPEIILAIGLFGVFYCSYSIGRNHSKQKDDQLIEQTMLYLCHEGYLKHRRDRDGEIELIKLNEEF